MSDEDIVREPGEITAEQHVDEWVKGNIFHNNNRWSTIVDDDGKILRREKMEGGECLPDFSCCEPRLLWPEEVRQSFKNADEVTRQGMLMQSLGKVLELAGVEDKVYVAGTIAAEAELKH